MDPVQPAICSRRLAVEAAEVLLHLAEVAEQLPGGAGELLEAVPLADRVEPDHLPPLGPGDLLVDRRPPPAQLGQAAFGVLLGAVDHLAQQVEDGVEPGLGADELPAAQVCHPHERLLHRWRYVVSGLVGPGRIELAQPAPLRSRPLVQVLARRPREALLAQALVEPVQLVVQLAGQGPGRHISHVAVDEHPAQERHHQGHVLGTQQRPGRVVGPEVFDLVVVHLPSPLPTSPPLSQSRSTVFRIEGACDRYRELVNCQRPPAAGAPSFCR